MPTLYHTAAVYASPLRQTVKVYDGFTLESLGERVKRLREQRGLSAARLGALAGIGEGAIFKIESGATKQPEFVTGARLAKALGVSADYLAGIDRESGSTPSDLLGLAREVAENQRTLELVLDALKSLGVELPTLVESPRPARQPRKTGGSA